MILASGARGPGFKSRTSPPGRGCASSVLPPRGLAALLRLRPARGGTGPRGRRRSRDGVPRWRRSEGRGAAPQRSLCEEQGGGVPGKNESSDARCQTKRSEERPVVGTLWWRRAPLPGTAPARPDSCGPPCSRGGTGASLWLPALPGFLTDTAAALSPCWVRKLLVRGKPSTAAARPQTPER